MSNRRREPRRFLALVLSLALAGVVAGRDTPMVTQLTTTEKDQLRREARLVVDLVQNLHYSGATFHEIKNEEILTRFLSELDPGGDFLTPDDVAFVHQRFDRSLKSVYLFRGDLEPAFEIFDLFAGLARDRVAWADRRLEQPFDFTTDESYTDPRPGEPAPSATLTPDQRWELRLKDQMLHEILSGCSPDAARAKLRRSYAEFGRALTAADSFAVRERFLDAAIRSFDPHSGYSSADSTREFSARMKGIVTGVGIAVAQEHDECRVVAVYPGGPADLHSTLAPGDSIEALAQGDGPWVEIKAQRLRDTLAAMRGPLTGKLRIAFRPAGGGERQEVALERAEVVIAADRARGATSKVPMAGSQARTIGWIALPAFYDGGEGPDAVSAARDVRNLLDQMKGSAIEGLVLDLRGNPGGSLREAVAMSQLFLPQGIVMFSRGANGVVKTHALEAKAPAYTGPLVVLTSATSASSAEIFTGAMKLHQRALVVGAPATFGKGTVQNYIELAKIQGLTGDAVKDWGTLRLTIERFFLPDGTGMQRRGVASDVVLPGPETAGKTREADLPHALPVEDITPPPDQIRAASEVPALTGTLRGSLVSFATADFGALPEWKLWQREQDLYRGMADRRTRSVRRETRSQAWEVTLGQLKSARRERNEFAAGAAFATQPLDLPVVRAAMDAHEAKLHALSAANSPAPLPHLQHGAFVVETDAGHLRDVSLQDVDLLSLLGDADTLAAAFSKGSGQAVTAANLRAFLEEVTALERRTDEAVRLAAAKLVPGAADPAAAQNGTSAMLQRITELEPELRQERPSLDVPLRECLRLAAHWAETSGAPLPVTRGDPARSSPPKPSIP